MGLIVAAGLLAAAAYLAVLVVTDGVVTAAANATLLVLLACAGWTALVGAVRAPTSPDRPPGWWRRLRREAGDGGAVRPERLVRLERLVRAGAGSAGAAHHRLRPVLRALAAQRLAARGVDLDRDPRARAELGEAAWELLRPDRPPPSDGRAPGPGHDGVAGVVDAIERAGTPAGRG